MIPSQSIQAALFDMDGTLIDSELNTELAVVSVCRELGIADPDLDYPAFYGTTWPAVVDAIAETNSAVADIPELALRFHKKFHDLCVSKPPPPIEGVRETIAALSAIVPVAIVSAAYRESIEVAIEQLDIETQIACYVGAEDFANSKPAPDCFLHAAGLLQVNPESCLVFEDSTAGLRAARAAGMWAIAITHRSNNLARARELGHLAIANYTELEADFVARVCGKG